MSHRPPAPEVPLRRFAASMAGVATAGLVVNAPASALAQSRIAPVRVRGALRAFWADGLLSAASDAFWVAYLPLLAASLGASATQIGMLAASQSLGAILALYPGAIASRRTGSRRAVVLVFAGTLARLSLLLTAFALAFSGGQVALYAIVGLATMRSFCANFALPAWTGLAADVIPADLRPRYFASRNLAMNLAALVFTPLFGLVLDHAGFPGGYMAACLASFALGMAATGAYARIPEPPRAVPAAAERKQRTGFRTIARDRRFALVAGATFTLQFATMIAGPFFNVYLKEQLGASNFMVGIVATASAISGMAGQVVCGDLMARRSALWLSRASLLVLPLLPLVWILINAPAWVLLLNLVGGFAWAGFNLANFQLLLDVTSEEDREEFVAVFHTCVFAALFLAPFLGGVIVDAFGYKPAFAVSGIARLAATGLFFFVLHEQGASRHAQHAPVVVPAER